MDAATRRAVLAELIGTALLVLVGLSIVILMFGPGSPLASLIPGEGLRRLITGFLFGTTGACIALSPVGKVSGAHINPAVTLAFRLMGKLDLPTTLAYIGAQLAGAVAGSLPLLLWGAMGKGVAFGATWPGPGVSLSTALLGEVVTTFTMVALLAVFLGFRRIRPFTPGLFPPLYAVMVWAEAPLSGTSTNPARSLGPAVVSGQWQGWWIYWVGPLLGMLLAVLACSFLAKRIEVAKLYYFDSDRDRLFRRMARPAPLAALLACLALGGSASAADPWELWPEGQLFVGLNPRTRVFLNAAYAKGMESEEKSLDAAAYLDVSFLPLGPRRRSALRTTDWQRGRYLWARLGYVRIFKVKETEDGPTVAEDRGILSLWGKFPLPGGVWLEGRTRADLRWIGGDYSTRYRLRLEATRELVVRDHAVVPYLNVEWFYDTRYDGWARTLYQAGAEFTVNRHFRFELLLAQQTDRLPSTSRLNAFGIVAKGYY